MTRKKWILVLCLLGIVLGAFVHQQLEKHIPVLSAEQQAQLEKLMNDPEALRQVVLACGYYPTGTSEDEIIYEKRYERSPDGGDSPQGQIWFVICEEQQPDSSAYKTRPAEEPEEYFCLLSFYRGNARLFGMIYSENKRDPVFSEEADRVLSMAAEMGFLP